MIPGLAAMFENMLGPVLPQMQELFLTMQASAAHLVQQQEEIKKSLSALDFRLTQMELLLRESNRR